MPVNDLERGIYRMTLPTRARIAGILAICLLMLGAPGALAGAAYSHDASIRVGNGAYVGEGFVNLDATNQSVSNGGVVGDKLTFWIKIHNSGQYADSYKVRRSAGYNNGYRVRYYNTEGTDVTGKVTLGSFTTPSLLTGQEYVMRATVKVRSLATEGSFTSRLITVSSVHNPSARDAVRFTGELSWISLDWGEVNVYEAWFIITGSGLKPGATVYLRVTSLFLELASGEVGTVSSEGDVFIDTKGVVCGLVWTISVMTLTPNGSEIVDLDSPPC